MAKIGASFFFFPIREQISQLIPYCMVKQLKLSHRMELLFLLEMEKQPVALKLQVNDAPMLNHHELLDAS